MPSVAREAIGWYDAADSATIQTNGTVITGVVNKGTGGASLDLTLVNTQWNRPSYNADGAEQLNGLPVMVSSNSEGLKSKGTTDIEGHGDRTLLSVSRQTASQAMYHVGLDGTGVDFKMEDWPEGRHLFRYSNKGDTTSVKSNPYLDSSENANGEWGVYHMMSEWSEESGVSAVTGSIFFRDSGLLVLSYGADKCGPSPELGTPADAVIGLGRMGTNARNSYGAIGEAFVFDKALSDGELAAMRTYLRIKWFDYVDSSVLPSSLALESGASLDLNGKDVTLASLSGSGTLSNGDVTVTGTVTITVNSDGTIDPIAVDGTLTLGANAKLVINGAQYLTATAMTAITATEGVTGTFAAVETSSGKRVKVVYAADGKSVSVRKSGGIMLIIH